MQWPCPWRAVETGGTHMCQWDREGAMGWSLPMAQHLQVLLLSQTLMWDRVSLLFDISGWWLLGHLSSHPSHPTRNSLASCLTPMASLAASYPFTYCVGQLFSPRPALSSVSQQGVTPALDPAWCLLGLPLSFQTGGYELMRSRDS